MKKLIVLALVGVFVMPLGVSQVFAADKTTQTGIVDVGNKLCPVMGGPVSGENFVVYEGKRYGLCCPGCDKTFLSAPEKYIARMGAKEKAAVLTVTATAEDMSASKEMEKDMEQGSL